MDCAIRFLGALGSVGLLRLLRTKPTQLTLHLYDHCPFCIRVELVLGWNGVKYARAVYGYGDTLGSTTKGLYYGGRTLTGSKQLPVLESADGAPLLPESGDIIARVERDHGALRPASGRPELAEFFNKNGVFRQLQRTLTRGEVIKMTHLMDWARSEDVEYAKAKYEGEGFDYEAAEAAKASSCAEMATLLKELEGLMLSDSSFYEDGQLGWDDVMYLPELRTLSAATGLEWPPKLRAYLETALAKANVQTYFK
eukprot:TRINITY_DN6628_c0_g1_i1.p2 TRINITY_DN6628_c0_g1~~TRINITY_DN6628_c0_g1_i1.p2  ORF type:complete len:254 (+),score=59.98 TRINITY_DN6628_c0_g1_i1:214-975(+)